MFGNIDLEVEDNVRVLNEGDDRLEGVLDENIEDIMANRKEATSKFWLNLGIKENMLVQKIKI